MPRAKTTRSAQIGLFFEGVVASLSRVGPLYGSLLIKAPP